MSINGIRSLYTPATPRQAPGVRPEPARSPVPAPATPRAPAAPATSAAGGAAAAPPGTDPDLWTVLTPDERAYFARLGAMGPLTYGRVLSGQTPAPTPTPRGVRLDVKA
ncbi:MAG: hypothetical protein IPK85_25335 [Gemmatimonadetes bacterium]|nr:hypothetical protein [Gemmatimonadota bacterium]